MPFRACGLKSRSSTEFHRARERNVQTSQTQPGRARNLCEMSFERTFFITTVTWQRTPLFRHPQKAELMMDVLAHYREQKKYALHEFVIMPDHVHLLITPAREISLERAMQLIKGGFSYRLGETSPSASRRFIWQESFTNHRVRDEQDYSRHAEYTRMNPVRARLVERAELYPYSSASRGSAIIDDRADAAS